MLWTAKKFGMSSPPSYPMYSCLVSSMLAPTLMLTDQSPNFLSIVAMTSAYVLNSDVWMSL